jgi:anti-sigma factor RsiW
MFSEHLQLLISGYVLGNLDIEEAAEFEQLLKDDPAVAVELAKMQKTLELAYNPAETPPPAHMRARIVGDNLVGDSPVKDSPIRETPAPAAVPRSPAGFRWNRVMGGAAAAAVVLLGINNYRLWTALQVAQQSPQPALQPEGSSETLTYELLGAESSAGSAALVVNPNRLEADLTTQNLPPLPAGKTYVLWTVVEPEAPVTKDSKSAILTEVFEADQEGNSQRKVIVPAAYRLKDAVVNFAITVEDAAAPQEHTGNPVLITKS